MTAKAEDAFKADTIHPAGSAGVPRPARAAVVHAIGVDVAWHHVRFGLVPVDSRSGSSPIDWVQHVEELHCLISISELRGGHHHPYGSVSVLAAVFPDTGDVRADIPRIRRGVVERRRQ